VGDANVATSGNTAERKLIIQQWIHCLLNLVIVVGVGAFLIPFIRANPKSVHDFAGELTAWQRVLLTFLLCVLVAHFMFKLFSPRVCHLLHVKRHPPTWLAWIVGLLVLAILDLSIGLSPSHYTASILEWAIYGLASVAVVWFYRWLTGPADPVVSKGAAPQTGKTPPTNDWKSMEEWLQSDAPAEYDFLGNYATALRLKNLLEQGTRSVGIVGPFGSGKTSIIKWLCELVSADTDPKKTRLVISEQSCWSFETSASSIHAMLADAIEKVEHLIDTFYVTSLPESYRQTFSSGGQWLDNVSKLLFGKQDPIDQFSRLSALLGNVNVRLVFVVEDLDRNDSRTFDIQEVQAFLQQLKDFSNLSFVLTGGLSSSQKIDFAKLCDHIEYLKSVDPRVAADMVQCVCERCFDAAVFPQEVLGGPDRQHVWNPLTHVLMHDLEEMSLPQAVASLLNTPRSLRHALGRTYTAWRELCGEIDWNHLLAVNVLRFAAPECFLFLVRRWDRLHSPPTSDPMYGRERLAQIRQSVANDWNQTIQNVEWSPTAARVVMEFILPASESWLADTSRSGSTGDAAQGVQYERYWRRAVNEAIDPQDVRDQVVIRDLRKWLESPSIDSELIVQICKSERYSDVWEDLAGRFLANDPDRILLLCQHVLTRIGNEEKAAASHDSQGFVAVWRFANRRVPRRPENRVWLEARITDAANTSIELVNGLWHYFGAGRYAVVRLEDADGVRQTEMRVLREQLVSADALERVLHPTYPYTFYQLVFDPGDHNPTNSGDVTLWTWLAPVLLETLRRGNALVAAGVASLVSSRDSGSRREPFVVDLNVLTGLFSSFAGEVVDRLGQLASQITDPEQQRLVNGIVESARVALANSNAVNGGN
jgi:hypothetical protein